LAISRRADVRLPGSSNSAFGVASSTIDGCGASVVDTTGHLDAATSGVDSSHDGINHPSLKRNKDLHNIIFRSYSVYW
jgi:hypothetical protein